MSMRWISDVPSKMVKILEYMQFPQVSGLQDSVVSARIQHALSEMNAGFRSGHVRFRAWYERTPRRYPCVSRASVGSVLRSR